MIRWVRGRVSRRLVAALAVGTLTASWAVAPASATATAAAAWQVQPTPSPAILGGYVIEGVSCPAATACTAVGGSLAYRWNGTSWAQQSTVSIAGATAAGLYGVSCPTAAFCEAVGGYDTGASSAVILAEDWNGSAWQQQTIPAPGGSANATLYSVSCASASSCEAVGNYQLTGGSPDYDLFAASWNGQTWRTQSVPQPARGAFRPRFNTVSCASATFCEATGNDKTPFAAQWNGTAWTLQTLPLAVNAVSCVSASFCEAVGHDHGDVWNGTAWASQVTTPDTGLQAVSCLSPTFCAAVGLSPHRGSSTDAADTWNGTSWTTQPVADPAGGKGYQLDGVSCASTGACEAGGGYQTTPQNTVTLAAGWNGTGWQLQTGVASQVPGADNLTAVSCVSASFCEAVGDRKDSAGQDTIALAEQWNGTTWTLQPTVSPAQANSNGLRMKLAAVSCVSADFCEAVGTSSAASGGGTEQWNGTKWTLQTTAGGALDTVSCTTADFCMAAGNYGHIDFWNGTAWSDQTASLDFIPVSLSCVSAEDCEAIGSPLGESDDYAEQWNGTSWTPQAVPEPSGGIGINLLAVSCTGATFCQAVGSYSTESTAENLLLAETWNGTSWAADPLPVPADPEAFLRGVACSGTDFCAAVGNQATPDTFSTLAEVWDGTSWTQRSTPNPGGNSRLFAVSCATAGTCTGVGTTYSGTDNNVQATLAETGG